MEIPTRQVRAPLVNAANIWTPEQFVDMVMTIAGEEVAMRESAGLPRLSDREMDHMRRAIVYAINYHSVAAGSA